MESGELAGATSDDAAPAKRAAEVGGAEAVVDPVAAALSRVSQVEPASGQPVDKPGVARRISCPKFDTAPAKLAELKRSRTGSSDPNAIAISSLVRGAIGGMPAHRAIPGLGRDQIAVPGAGKTLEPASAAAALSPKGATPGPKGGGRLNASAFGSAPARGSRPRPAVPAEPATPAEPASPTSPSLAVPVVGAPVAASATGPATGPAVDEATAPSSSQLARRLDQPVSDSDRRLILSKFASAPTRGRAAPRREGKAQRPSLPVHQEAEHGQSDDEGGRVDRPADRPAHVRRRPLDAQSNASEDVHGEGMSDLGEETPQASAGEPGAFLGVTCEEEGA